jgi:FAD binding domain-containing protein
MNVGVLEHELRGQVVSPGDRGWDQARASWNLAADQHPVAAVFAEGAEDIAAAISFARANDLHVAPQGTGHGARRGSADGALLVRTERMRGIEIDAGSRMARVEAGAVTRELGAAASQHGLSALSGTSADVGYTLGGGLGWLARRHGLACNKVRAIELVTADGELRRVDAATEPDLFWALRGGGGGFAVVSALELELVELVEVYAGAVIHPADERSGEILRRYFDWAHTVPDEVTSLARFLHAPPLPTVPEPLRDRHVIMLGACYAGPSSEGTAVIGPLTQFGEPVIETFNAMAPSELVSIGMEREQPTPAISDTTTLDAGRGDPRVRRNGGARGGIAARQRRAAPTGGALATPPERGGARSHLDGAAVFNGTGVPRDPQLAPAIHEQIDKISDALAPYSKGSRLSNFAGRPTSAELLFDPGTLAHLRQVKRRYDPESLIEANLTLENRASNGLRTQSSASGRRGAGARANGDQKR